MTEHESDPRQPGNAGAEPEPAAPAAAPQDSTSPRPLGADQPTAQQPAVDATAPQPATGAPAPVWGTTAGGDQPRSPWQAPTGYPQSTYPHGGQSQGGHPHYPYPGGGYPQSGYPQAGAAQHAAPGAWAGGGPGGPPPAPGQPWQQHHPQRPSRVGRWIAGIAAALVLLLGAGVVGGVIGAAVTGRDNDNAAARAAAAPVINRSSLAEIAQKVEPSVVSITTGSGEGSGVVLSDDGYVLTNNHVVAGAGGGALTVVFDNGKRASATVVGTDPKTDLAVLKASGVSGLSPATFGDSGAMQVGDTVLALGSPLGLQGSVTAGIISAKDRTIRTQDQQQNPFSNQPTTVTSLSGLLQTDAPINPGNSGGPLVNTNGEVIGINTAIATSGQGNGSIGVGFAIPSNKAKQVADALRSGEKVSHPALGVGVTESENGEGAMVTSVTPDSPAAKAGLQQGDIITEFDGTKTNTSDELVAAVQSHKVGDQVKLTYIRNGQQNTATVTLAEAS